MIAVKKWVCISILAGLLQIVAVAQDDETRQGTGLPTLIGENSARGGKMNVSGQITLQGFDRKQRQPVINVRILLSGATADSTITNDTGFYLLRNVPRENVVLVVEIDGAEVTRQPIVSSPMGNPRIDISIPWPIAADAVKPGVIAARPVYDRSPKNEEIFQSAMAASKAKETTKAISLLNKVLESDPKDFVAWTELGTIYFKENQLDNGEGCYFKAIELKRDYALALLNLGKLYMSKKQYDNAVLALSNAVKSSPDSSDAHHFLGESYLQLKKGSLAVVSLNEAIRLSPGEKAELHLRLASLYDSAGMKGKASAEYKAFLLKRPDFAQKAQLEKYIADNPAN